MARPARILWLLIAIAASLATGCVIRRPVVIGEPLPVEALAGLVSGETAERDVLDVLGDPRGRGVLRIDRDSDLRPVWYYEYIRASIDREAVSTLLVFLHEGRYEGHLWLRSPGTGLPSGFNNPLAKTQALCSDIHACSASFQLGPDVDLDLLESRLQPRRPTRSEVRVLLGEPSGAAGLTSLPVIAPKPRETWVYFRQLGRIESTSGEDGRSVAEREAWLRLLFIYFDEGRYDGYLWLSTLPEDLSALPADPSAP